MSEVKEWWNNASSGYQSEFNLPVDIHYGPSTPNEDELQLLGDLNGKDVLELGCGGAQCSVAFALKGATVTGIDFSSEQLKFAENLASEHNVTVTFYELDVRKLEPIADESQDIVFSAFLLLYVEDRKAVFEEAMRVLRPGGLFVFSLDHPMYRKVDPETLTMVESYHEEGELIDDWGEFGKTSYFAFTTADLVNQLIDTGFRLERLVEPDSRIRYDHDPWFGLYGIYVPKILDMVPPTIVFKSRKPA